MWTFANKDGKVEAQKKGRAAPSLAGPPLFGSARLSRVSVRFVRVWTRQWARRRSVRRALMCSCSRNHAMGLGRAEAREGGGGVGQGGTERPGTWTPQPTHTRHP